MPDTQPDDSEALQAYLTRGIALDDETMERLRNRLKPVFIGVPRLVRDALYQELDQRTEGEMDPAEANRAAVQFAIEVSTFIKNQGERIAFRIEEAQAQMASIATD